MQPKKHLLNIKCLIVNNDILSKIFVIFYMLLSTIAEVMIEIDLYN